MVDWASNPTNPSNRAPAFDLSHTAWYAPAEQPVRQICLVCGGERMSDEPHDVMIASDNVQCFTGRVMISYAEYQERVRRANAKESHGNDNVHSID